jgi:Flp pilus assembly protein TadD
MSARALLLLFASVASACVPVQPRTERPSTPQQKKSEQAAIYRDAVRGLMAKQQYLAALAHIQEGRRQAGDSSALRLLEADARRHLGQTAAATAIYQTLLTQAEAAEAYQGLGLLEAQQGGGALNTAIDHLKRAVRLKPVDVQKRNDLGFALLQARRFKEARAELATAVELAPTEPRARNNLLILLMAEGDRPALQRVLSAAAPPIEPALLARLFRQAQSLDSAAIAP